MVHVYITDTSLLPDPREHPQWLTGLPTARREHVLRPAGASARRDRLGSSLLLQTLFQQHGTDWSDLSSGKYGKPEVDGLCFNLSHSHGMAVCAVGSAAVGCDIERIAPVRERVVRRAFSPAEQAHLARFSGPDRDREFTRLWTMKESYLKMTGEGLRLPLDQIVFSPGSPIIATRDEVPCPCFVKEYTLSGYCLSVCSPDPEFAPDLHPVCFPQKIRPLIQ